MYLTQSVVTVNVTSLPKLSVIVARLPMKPLWTFARWHHWQRSPIFWQSTKSWLKFHTGMYFITLLSQLQNVCNS